MASHTRPQSCDDFHIAILCALPLEASAVIVQFDEFWDNARNMFAQAPGDRNEYSYGSIGHHNVVVAHMPGMGKASAAGVATSIGNSFVNIELALVVGICGGVPYRANGEQIRLGDVIISEGLVEHDFQKRYPDKAVRKDVVLETLGRPVPKIRSLINKLKSDRHEKQLASKTYENLKRLQQFSDKYPYPGVEADQLFKPGYRHKHHGALSCLICSKCTEKDDEVCPDALDLSCLELKCDDKMTIPRRQAAEAGQAILNYEPMIHYGLVASGDTVMKSGEDRDAIAKKDKVIAFEMEGAGVWEKLPCVVIKGVCDYADSHKDKKWQNYAAATGTSCMKAFLEQWRPAKQVASLTIQPDNSIQMIQCLRSLSFSNIDDREGNITLAHQDTCNWLFETPQFKLWQSRHDLSSHHGVLWLKGKPGLGKSTLMKHTLLYYKENFKDHIIAAYFFNARGNTLEKTPLGMLRSLLYQLLDQDQSLRERFLLIFLDKQTKLDKEWQWSIGELKNYLLSEMRRSQPGRRPLLLFIDALDECNEPDVREVVSFLESLSISAVSSDTMLNICLSSRYYPTIDIKVKMELVLEEQVGHDQDIAKYVHHKLRVQDKEIENELLRKAQHVFMWVVLVVEMVNKAFDDGKGRAMRKKLNEVPSDLDEVFSILLNCDERNKQETILVLQWVLFAEQLLKPEELYFAVLAGIEEDELGPWNQRNDPPEAIKRYITNTSRGLVEIRKTQTHRRTIDSETVQFIHESVKDFLLRNNRIKALDSQLTHNPVSSSHDRLAVCCMSYIMMKDLDPTTKNRPFFDEDTKEPLSLKYPFLEYAANHLLYHANRAHEGGCTQEKLMRQLQSVNGKFDRVQNLHDISCSLSWKYAGGDLLYAAACEGRGGLVQIILFEHITDVNTQGGEYGNALQAASWHGSVEIVKLLLENGAEVNAQGGEYGNALQAASLIGSLELVKLLLENGAEGNAQGGSFGNALQAAALYNGSTEIVQLLLENGAEVNAQGGPFGNALQAASWIGSLEVVKLLLENGAEVNAQGGSFGNALQAATTHRMEEVVKLLLKAGATPLQTEQVIEKPVQRKRKRKS